MLFFMVMMVLSLLVHIYQGMVYAFQIWNRHREIAAQRKREAEIDARYAAINARLRARPVDPDWVPPPPMPLRPNPGFENAGTQTDLILGPGIPPQAFVPPEPVGPRRRNRTLRKFQGRDVVHFSDCVHLQHDFNRSVLVGRLCLVCGD